MGCDDIESHWQYTYFNPDDGKWWCKQGYTPVYAAPRGYEGMLAEYVARQWKSHIRFKAAFNISEQMWEVRPILD